MKHVALWLFLVMSQTAFAGNEGGGGGNVAQSSSWDVWQTINDIFDQKFEDGGLVSYFRALGQSLNSVQDPELRALFEKMLAPNLTLDLSAVWDLASTQPTFNETGPCMATVGPQDAAVSANKPGASICYSIPRLTRFPKAELKADLTALTASELSHHYGASEELAQKVQAFFLKWIPRMNQVQMIEGLNQKEIASMKYLVQRLRTGSAGRSAQVCAELGSLYGLESSTITAIDLLEPLFANNGTPEDNAFHSAADPFYALDDRFSGMLGYCGGTASGDITGVPAASAAVEESVAVGDSKALIGDLETETEYMEKVGTALPSLSIAEAGQ